MRASFLGCPVDLLTMAETVDLARGAMRSKERLLKKHSGLTTGCIILSIHKQPNAARLPGGSLSMILSSQA